MCDYDGVSLKKGKIHLGVLGKPMNPTSFNSFDGLNYSDSTSFQRYHEIQRKQSTSSSSPHQQFPLPLFHRKGATQTTTTPPLLSRSRASFQRTSAHQNEVQANSQLDLSNNIETLHNLARFGQQKQLSVPKQRPFLNTILSTGETIDLKKLTWRTKLMSPSIDSNNNAPQVWLQQQQKLSNQHYERSTIEAPLSLTFFPKPCSDKNSSQKQPFSKKSVLFLNTLKSSNKCVNSSTEEEIYQSLMNTEFIEPVGSSKSNQLGHSSSFNNCGSPQGVFSSSYANIRQELAKIPSTQQSQIEIEEEPLIKRNMSLLVYATSQKQQPLQQRQFFQPDQSYLIKREKKILKYISRENSLENMKPFQQQSQVLLPQSCFSVKRADISQLHSPASSSNISSRLIISAELSSNPRRASFTKERISLVEVATTALPLKRRSVSMRSSNVQIKPQTKRPKKKKQPLQQFGLTELNSLTFKQRVTLPSNFLVFCEKGFSRFTSFFSEEFMRKHMLCFLSVDECLSLRVANKVLAQRVSRYLYSLSVSHPLISSLKSLKISESESIACLVEAEIPEFREIIENFLLVSERQMPDTKKLVIPPMNLLPVLHIFAIIFGEPINGISDVLSNKLQWKKFFYTCFVLKTARRCFERLKGIANLNFLFNILKNEIYTRTRSTIAEHQSLTKRLNQKEHPFLQQMLFFVERILDLYEKLILNYSNTFKYIKLVEQIQENPMVRQMKNINDKFHKYAF